MRFKHCPTLFLFLLLLAHLNTGALLAENAKLKSPRSSSNQDQVQVLNETLSKPVDLPDLPAYPGKVKFMRGIRGQTDLGTAVQMTFDAKEEQPRIIEWYENALHMYRWKAQRTSPHRLSADHKDGHKCVITTSAPHEPGKGNISSFTVFYQIRERR